MSGRMYALITLRLCLIVLEAGVETYSPVRKGLITFPMLPSAFMPCDQNRLETQLQRSRVAAQLQCTQILTRHFRSAVVHNGLIHERPDGAPAQTRTSAK
jgi:hypothetical protein